MDPQSRSFAVILIAESSKRWLPIFIGPFEAQAIAAELEHFKPPRPLTHDLIKNLVELLGATITKVSIHDLRENTFYATVSVEINGTKRDLDSRPSDAIAIGLRMKAPLFVSEEVMARAGQESAIQENEKSKKLKDLQLKLSNAIDSENYEDAAKFRDDIRKIRLGSPEKFKKLKALKAKYEEAMRKEEFEEITKLQEEIRRLEAEGGDPLNPA